MVPEHGFEDEFAFFEAAADDPAIYETFRQWITRIAEEEVDRIADGSIQRFVLVAAAMQPFDRAFKAYQKREAVVPRAYPFSEYFRWWARQHALMRQHEG